jgi:sulfatase maturation enzyme AslB (radical SAM superfamily)
VGIVNAENIQLTRKPRGWAPPPPRTPREPTTVTYLDEPVEFEVAGRRVQYAPMRMEWTFDPDEHPLAAEELHFTLGSDELAVLQIHVTEGCNLRCSYCSHFNNPRKGAGTLSDEEIERLLDEVRSLPAHGVLILHGGEPFTEPETVFRFVEESPVTTVIYTNGTLLTDEVLARLKGTKAVLLISADGEPETTGQTRVGRGPDEVTPQIFEGIARAAASGIPFGIAMVMADHNVDHIERQVRYLVDRFNPDSLGVNPTHFLANAPVPTIDADGVADAYVRLLRVAIEDGLYIDQISRRLTPMIRGVPLLKDCSACGSKLVYHPGGRWMNCTNNVEDDTSIDAWSRYLPVLTPSCHGCIAIGMCGGGCIADAKALNPGGFDPRFCNSNRALVRAVLERCADDSSLQRTNRDRLAHVFGSLLQRGRREGGNALHRSVGHDAYEAEGVVSAPPAAASSTGPGGSSG